MKPFRYVPLFVLVLAACPGGEDDSGKTVVTTAEICTNGVDDDADSYADCVDPDHTRK